MKAFVYVIECRTPNVYYVGVTSDVERRRRAHFQGKGSSCTKRHGVKSFTIIPNITEPDLVRKLWAEGKEVYGAGWCAMPYDGPKVSFL